jgi:hypothetical protein
MPRPTHQKRPNRAIHDESDEDDQEEEHDLTPPIVKVSQSKTRKKPTQQPAVAATQKKKTKTAKKNETQSKNTKTTTKKKSFAVATDIDEVLAPCRALRSRLIQERLVKSQQHREEQDDDPEKIMDGTIKDSSQTIMTVTSSIPTSSRPTTSSSPSSIPRTDIVEVSELSTTQVMDEMENLAIRIAHQVLANKGFQLEVPSRASSNQIYIPEWDRIVLGNKVGVRSFLNVKVNKIWDFFCNIVSGQVCVCVCVCVCVIMTFFFDFKWRFFFPPRHQFHFLNQSCISFQFILFIHRRLENLPLPFVSYSYYTMSSDYRFILRSVICFIRM